MATTALILSFATFGYAVLVHRRASIAYREAKRLYQSLASTRLALLREVESLRADMPLTIQTEIMRSNGDLRFTRTTTIDEAISIDSRVKDVLKQFHIGGCSSCSVSGYETIEQAAAAHEVDGERLLGSLNAMLEGRPIPPPEPVAAHSVPVTIGGFLS